MTTVVIVTGAASGLGLKTVEVLLDQGYKVSAWDLNPVSIFSPSLIQFTVDVTDTNSISKALESTISIFSKVDVLINLAGIVSFSPLFTESSVHSLAEWEKIMKINLIGTFDVSRQVSKYINNGLIILVASICAFGSTGSLVAYAATKMANVSLAMPMSRDLAFKNTRVISISPGLIETPLSANVPAEGKARFIKESAVGRLGKTEDFAHAVLFAINNKYLNGCNLDLNGGSIYPNL